MDDELTGIGIPDMDGLVSRGMDFIVGIGAGALAQIAGRYVSSDLLGSAVVAVAAGAFLDPQRGRIVSTQLGYQASGSSEVRGVLDRLPG